MATQAAYTDSFDEVLEAEYAAVRERRGSGPAGARDRPADLFGVCLSGGGMRSACFSLGALQALQARGLIDQLDYLSTVSGGGYTGAGMVAGIARDGAFPYERAPGDPGDSDAVARLRDHSRFLAPQGLRDILLSLAVYLRGLAVNLVILLAVLLPLATVTILANPTQAHLDRSFLFDIVAYFWQPGWKTSGPHAWWGSSWQTRSWCRSSSPRCLCCS